MSREAFNNVLDRVMRDPLTQARGVSSDTVRKELRHAARVADRNPLKPADKKPDPEPVRQVVRTRAKVDKGSELHFDLDRAHGTAPPRVARHQKAETVTHDPVLEGAREMLERHAKK